MEYPTAQVVEIMDYISCMYDCSSCTLSVQFHAEVRMDIIAFTAGGLRAWQLQV